MTGLVVREMTIADVPSMAALEAAVSREPWSAELFAGELDMHASERHWLVAVSVGEDGTELLTGFAGFMYIGVGAGAGTREDSVEEGSVDAGEAHLMNIAVDPAFQRMRVARRLLHGLIRAARSRNVDRLTLEVRPDNGPARALYHRFGMDAVGTRPRYYGDGGDALIMWVHGILGDEYAARLDRLAEPEWSDDLVHGPANRIGDEIEEFES